MKLKAITISQPFAHLITTGEKWVENRSWKSWYFGPIAIHAGKGVQYMTKKDIQARGYPMGAITAVGRLVACLEIGKIHERGVDDTRPTGCNVRTWRAIREHEHAEGAVCWILEDVRKLKEPIPCNGAQGLWNFEFDFDPFTPQFSDAIGLKTA